MKTNDVLFCLVRPYLKNIAIVPPELNGEIASTAYFVVSPKEEMESKFLFYQLIQESFINSVKTYGSSPPSARDEEFKKMKVYLAPMKEQLLTVRKIEECFSRVAKVENLVENRLKMSKSLKRSILKRAFEGKLVSQDPKDEPAEMLLIRIREENSAKNTPKPKLNHPKKRIFKNKVKMK